MCKFILSLNLYSFPKISNSVNKDTFTENIEKLLSLSADLISEDGSIDIYKVEQLDSGIEFKKSALEEEYESKKLKKKLKKEMKKQAQNHQSSDEGDAGDLAINTIQEQPDEEEEEDDD